MRMPFVFAGCVVFLFFAVCTSAGANISIVMDESGDGNIVISDGGSTMMENAVFKIDAEHPEAITISGEISDIAMQYEADYFGIIDINGSSIKVEGRSYGDEMEELLSMTGPMRVEANLSVRGETGHLNVSADLDKKLVEGLFYLNVSSIMGDIEEFKSEIEGILNEAVGTSGGETLIHIDDLSIEENETLHIRLVVSIENGNALVSGIMSVVDEMGSPWLSDSFIECLGAAGLPEGEMASGLDINVWLNSSRSSIGFLAQGYVKGATSLLPYIKSLYMGMQKNGKTATFTGVIMLNKPKEILTCALREIIPGEYEVEELSFSVNSEGHEGVLRARMNGLARKREDSFVLEFPPTNKTIRVEIPEDMEILSISGGEKKGPHVAVSLAGKEFQLVYGRATGIDTTVFLLISGIIIIALILWKKR